MDNNWKPSSLKAAETVAKRQLDHDVTKLEKEEIPNLKYIDDLDFGKFERKINPDQLDKLQSYMVVTDLLDRLTWVSPTRLNAEAGEYFAEGVPQTTMNDMVLLGLANQNQDEFGQISYQPTFKTTEERKAIFKELFQRFEDERPRQSRDTLRMPFDLTFKKQLIERLTPIHGWLTSGEILKIMGYDVTLTDKRAENFRVLLDHMVKNDQLELHKDDMFRLKRQQ